MSLRKILRVEHAITKFSAGNLPNGLDQCRSQGTRAGRAFKDGTGHGMNSLLQVPPEDGDGHGHRSDRRISARHDLCTGYGAGKGTQSGSSEVNDRYFIRKGE